MLLISHQIMYNDFKDIWEVLIMKLQNKVAVVTGGAMGNGLGIVKVFLKHGAKVAILDYIH